MFDVHVPEENMILKCASYTQTLSTKEIRECFTDDCKALRLAGPKMAAVPAIRVMQ